ncbi:MAG: nickel pincer cofactor biosynthesis protein LarC [Victivallaceae bacterium]
MSNFLYIDGRCGISGDMMVAALLDLGGDFKQLLEALKSIDLGDEFNCVLSEQISYSIAGKNFDVILPENQHEHHHNSGNHFHRNLSDINTIIAASTLNDRAKNLAQKIFRIVAEAEAKVHGKSIDEVHFHEVGAVDSIVDIVSAAYLIDVLNIDQVTLCNLSEGTGTVRCQHGILPIPVPAVAEILSQYKIPLQITDTIGEMITPTGAAILAALVNSSPPEKFVIQKIGLGVGKRDFGRPNILRLMLLQSETVPKSQTDSSWVLESNIDDSSGEILGLAMERLFQGGALDVHYVPCFMKKNRPGWLLRVIAPEAKLDNLAQLIFSSTTTIGIRRFPAERYCMVRENILVDTEYGRISVKICRFGELLRCYPEYESVKSAAGDKLDFQLVYSAAKLAAESAATN